MDEAVNEGRDVTVLLRSTKGAWLRSELDATPDTAAYPQYGFPVVGEQAARHL